MVGSGAEVPCRLPWQPVIILFVVTLFCIGVGGLCCFSKQQKRQRERFFYFSNIVQYKKLKRK